MVVEFNKDKWIYDMLRKGYLVARRDGTILRAKSADKVTGVVNKEKGYNIVKQQIHKATGRVYFNCTYRGITKSVLTNRVIALRFHSNPKRLPVVNHIDGNKENNAADNLEWISPSENERHAHRTGLKSGRGSANSNAKLTAHQVMQIRSSIKPDAALAEEFGVSRSTITNIKARKTWSHV